MINMRLIILSRANYIGNTIRRPVGAPVAWAGGPSISPAALHTRLFRKMVTQPRYECEFRLVYNAIADFKKSITSRRMVSLNLSWYIPPKLFENTKIISDAPYIFALFKIIYLKIVFDLQQYKNFCFLYSCQTKITWRLLPKLSESCYIDCHIISRTYLFCASAEKRLDVVQSIALACLRGSHSQLPLSVLLDMHMMINTRDLVNMLLRSWTDDDAWRCIMTTLTTHFGVVICHETLDHCMKSVMTQHPKSFQLFGIDWGRPSTSLNVPNCNVGGPSEPIWRTPPGGGPKPLVLDPPPECQS